MSNYNDMNDTTCPYDGLSCRNKQSCLEELKMFAFRNPELIVPHQTNLFAGCPIKSEPEREEICNRYHQYLAILKQEKTK